MSSITPTTRLPVHYVSHGGGPWPWMKATSGGQYDHLERALQALIPALPERPRAVVMVTAHWEEDVVAISSSPHPGMLYDYYGFPAHTYQIRYPAPGSPVLAEHIRQLLEAGGVAARLDDQRGFDHGTFSVAAVALPAADLPIVQVSILKHYDPAAHLALGRLLAPLRDEGVLIIGSGLSYHDLRNMGASGAAPSAQFDAWLQETLACAPTERAERLLHWAEAPAARAAHPREDHLLPLMAAVGAAGDDPVTCDYHEVTPRGLTLSGFRFSALG